MGKPAVHRSTGMGDERQARSGASFLHTDNADTCDTGILICPWLRSHAGSLSYSFISFKSHKPSSEKMDGCNMFQERQVMKPAKTIR